MAINKKLIHFKSKENFASEVANGNILDNSIVFIQDSKEISTHGTIYKTVNWSVLERNLITFTLSGYGEFQAEEGMTWEEFCNSKYNTDSFTIHDGTLRYGEFTIMIEGGFIIYPDDVIIANGVYIQRYDGGGGYN